MKRLILIRHAESISNLLGIWDNSLESRLSEQGKTQANKLKEYLSNYNAKIIYSSDAKRAYSTARIIMGDQNNSHLIIRKELREWDFGLFNGLNDKQVAETYPKQAVQINSGNFEKFPNGESVFDVEKRMLSVVEEALLLNEENTIFVSHGAALSVLMGYFMAMPAKNRISLKQDNCCINIININNGFIVDKYNYLPEYSFVK